MYYIGSFGIDFRMISLIRSSIFRSHYGLFIWDGPCDRVDFLLIGIFTPMFQVKQPIAIRADSFMDPIIRPIAYRYFIAPPFVPQFVVKEPVIVCLTHG